MCISEFIQFFIVWSITLWTTKNSRLNNILRSIIKSDFLLDNYISKLIWYLEGYLSLCVLVSKDVIAARPPGIMLRVLQVDALKEYDLLVHVLLREVGREHTK